MSAIEGFKVNSATLGLSYITQFFQYGTSLIILPFILSFLSSKELGVWYIFLSVSNISVLIDFGFSTSLSRNVSFVFSGAKELIKDGNPSITDDKSINYALLKSILNTSIKTYFIISVIILGLLSTIGSVYIVDVTKESGISNILLLWCCFTFSTAFNYFYRYVLIFIKGRGQINLYNKVILFSRISYLLVVLLLIFCGFGLWSLIIGNFVSALLSRLYGLHCFYDEDLKKKLSEIVEEDINNLFPTIWYNAKKFGISSFASYAFTQSVVLISGAFLDLEDVAKLGLISQLATAVVNFARVYFLTYYPKICSLWVLDDKKQIINIFKKSQLVGYFIWLASFGFLLFAGNYSLQLIHSNTVLPNSIVIGLYCFYAFMELTHGNCSMLISSRNIVPMFRASIISCVVAILLMFILGYLDFGIYSFPLAIVLANLPYNSWKWPLYAYRMLK